MKNTEILSVNSRAEPAQAEATSPRQQILVVDDDSAMRRLNREVLLAYGYAVDSAEDGAVAWSMLQNKKYDLLLTDNNMPNMSGIALLQKLHANGLALPVIMATGTLPEDKAGEAEQVQPITILLKPYAYDELVRAVEKVVGPAAQN